MTLDQFVKFASIAGGIILGAWAVLTYYDTANRDLEKPFNDAQLALCKDASDAAATLATIAPRPVKTDLSPTDKLEDPWRVARVRFEQLYWGSLAMFENADVEDKMVKFRTLLRANEDDIAANKLNTATRPFLQNAALAIAHACRDLVSKTWKITLPELTGKGASTAN
jgi:hypothetical protein